MKPPKGVPRDEWLLAIGLANHGTGHSAFVPGLKAHKLAGCITGRSTLYPHELFFHRGGAAASAAYNGAWNMCHSAADWFCTDVRQPDAYAAGAALAMALEDS